MEATAYFRNGDSAKVGAMTKVDTRPKRLSELQVSQEQLLSLVSELSLAQQRQQRRISMELHENIGQILAASKLKIGMLREQSFSPELAGTMDEITALMDKTIQDVRSLAFELSPPILHNLGLAAAVDWLLEQTAKRHGIAYCFENDQQPKPLNDDISALLYYAVQELLVNVAKHARAEKVEVSIERLGGTIKIVVADDGVGFDTAQSHPALIGKDCFGLFSIQERLRQLSGKLTIESAPGCGCRITLTAPLGCY